MKLSDKSSPIEVWLTQKNMIISCRVVHEDESTEELDIDSLSVRGAQREVTGYLIGLGYKPEGRWTTAYDGTLVGDDESAGETVRRFKVSVPPPPQPPAIPGR